MRLVLDTNVVIAGMLWAGPPRHLINHAIDEKVTLYSSPALIGELARALPYAKLARRLKQIDVTPDTLTAEYTALVNMVSPTQTPRVIDQDTDDDHVLACAVAAQAGWIVSGDKHLHSIGSRYQGILILSPAHCLAHIGV